MEKDSQAKLGRTKCDFCDKPSTVVRGNMVLCDAHAEEAPAGVKQGAARDVPLKSAGLVAEDLHS